MYSDELHIAEKQKANHNQATVTFLYARAFALAAVGIALLTIAFKL